MTVDNVIEFKKPGLKLEVNSDDSVKDILDLIEKNFSQGEKSIAFGSTHYKNSQEKSIVLACDFFNKKFPTLKVLIVTFDTKSGVFSPFFEAASKKNNLYQYQRNLFFLNWEELLKDEEIPQKFVDDFDMVFWDLPALDVISKRQFELRSSFDSMDGLYLISLKNNKFDERGFMMSIMHYYQDHGLDIRTILPWTIEKRKQKERSKITVFFSRLFRR